jgi:hypothetical protein
MGGKTPYQWGEDPIIRDVAALLSLFTTPLSLAGALEERKDNWEATDYR